MLILRERRFWLRTILASTRVQIRSDQKLARVIGKLLDLGVPAFDSTPIWDELVRKDIAAIPHVIPQPLPSAHWTWFEASQHGQRFGAFIARRQLAPLIPDGGKEDIYASAVRRAKADGAEELICSQHWTDASGAAKYCGMSFYWRGEGGAVDGMSHLIRRPGHTADQMLPQRIVLQRQTLWIIWSCSAWNTGKAGVIPLTDKRIR